MIEEKLIYLFILVLVACSTIPEQKFAQREWFDCYEKNSLAKAWVKNCS